MVWWWNSRNLWILLENMIFDKKFRNFDFCLKMLSTWPQMQNSKPHPNLSTQTRHMKFKLSQNKELHIPMQIALNNRKIQTGIPKICHILSTDGQNEMRFSFLCFLIKRELCGTKFFFFFIFVWKNTQKKNTHTQKNKQTKNNNTFFDKNHKFLEFYQNIILFLI